MAYNPTKTRTWKDGTTPATGTLALGSLFEAEFNRLYANDAYFKVYFATDNRLSINDIDSLDGNGVNFLDSIGYNIDAPVTQLHLNEATSGSCLAHFTNLTTGDGANNGFSIGIDSSENAVLHNWRNTDMIFYVNNTEGMRLESTGLKITGIATGQTANTNYDDLVINSNDYCGITLLSANNKSGTIAFGDNDDNYIGGIGYNHPNNYLFFYANNTTIASLYSTGLFIGSGTYSGNLLHIMGSPSQLRIGYDSDSFWTFGVANGGDLTIAAGEATGRITLTPGASDPLVNISSGCYLAHNGNAVAGYLNDGTPYYKKILDIGDWNMDSTASITVAHGLTTANIRNVFVIIRSDNDAIRIPLDYYSQVPSPISNGYFYISGSDVYLLRTSGGGFDATNYNDTSYNRGWIIIEYV